MNQIFYQVFNVFCLENIKVISQKLGHCGSSADFKYDNSFFKILAQSYPNMGFFVQKLGIFNISQTFAIIQIS